MVLRFIIVVIVSDGSKFFLEKQKNPGTLESAAEERNYLKYTKYNMLLLKKCWFVIIIRYCIYGTFSSVIMDRMLCIKSNFLLYNND